MGSDKVFIVGGRSFMYIMKSKEPRTDLWGTPYFVPHSEKKLCFLGDLTPCQFKTALSVAVHFLKSNSCGTGMLLVGFW
jgi:hypothetical protein